MKKTLQKLTLSVLAVGSLSLLSDAALAQGGKKPTYLHDTENTNGKGFFVKGVHSTESQGVVTDPAGRVWTISWYHGFYVVNPDGSEYKLPAAESGDLTYAEAPIAGVPYPHVSAIFTDAGQLESFHQTGRGLALAHDGNILVARGNVLYKLNYLTGEPIARWQAPSTNISSPSSDANGNIFLTSVTDNKNYIIKQSETNPSEFVVVMGETAFPGRTKEVVRSSAISKDGKTIYVPYDNRNNIDKYTSTDMVNWTLAGTIETASGSNAIVTGPNNVLWYITIATNPVLHFRDEKNATYNWSQAFGTEVGSNNIKGMSFTKGYDTLYIASGSLTGNIHRFITYDEVILSVRKDDVAKAVTAFPVPTAGQVTIEMPESIRRASTIQVTDLTGKNIAVRQTAVDRGASLDLRGLSAGTYLVVVNTAEGNIVRRVVKQ
ncbi:T9SS type A sorting domain-containing protein [Rufibacter roseus]|uniref:T9SS type A sorting domain-containing protein n=1 Tax=Rufibacter roseus TaxID=1567108 RepID=A0ABW2DHN1_9BACT|nr:T9SS type A sorting domain-containing protein [Rufibacter roseus]